MPKSQTKPSDNQNNKSSTKKCFVITPIGDETSEIRREIEGVINQCVEPVLKQCGYEVFVAHRICVTGSINDQVISHIYEDDLVIANLTGLNPNVMYELAFRHAIQKPVIVIKNKDDGMTLPFDIKDDRVIFYTNDIHGTGNLISDLKSFINEINFKVPSDNPISRGITNVNIRKNLSDNSKTDNLQINEYLLNQIEALSHKIDQLVIPNNVNNFVTTRPEIAITLKEEFNALNKSFENCDVNDKKSVQNMIEKVWDFQLLLNKNKRNIPIYDCQKYADKISQIIKVMPPYYTKD